MSRGIIFLLLFSFGVFTALVNPAYASNHFRWPQDKMYGILTKPEPDNNHIYFAGWPGTLYSFNEASNETIWTSVLDPLPDNVALENLPAPPPEIVGSFIMVHIGDRLWGISKIDGRSVWSINGLPQASAEVRIRSGNTLPGYLVSNRSDPPDIFTIEYDGTLWNLHCRHLGNGTEKWRYKLPGVPRAWWLIGGNPTIVCQLYGPNGAGPENDSPSVVVSVDQGNGDLNYSSPAAEDVTFLAALRSSGRIFRIEGNSSGRFIVTSTFEDTGEYQNDIEYHTGEFLSAFQSDDKIVMLHRKEGSESEMLDYRLYYSSLSPIRYQTLLVSRDDQIFSEPWVDGNLFFFGGKTYSLYNGNQVWRDDIQRNIIDWVVDDHQLYAWDATGYLICFERLTGNELWKSAFDILPPEPMLGPKYSGAGLVLDDDRIIAFTPASEIYRISESDGEIYPGVLKVNNSMDKTDAGIFSRVSGSEKGKKSLALILIIALLVVAGVIFVVVGYKRTTSKSDEFQSPEQPEE
jgi:outer membrane protein assembly factor BamB